MDRTITIEDFSRLDIRVGTIVQARLFPEARKPAYQLVIDFGPLGQRCSSAGITDHYRLDQLEGRQVLAVVNFPPRQIGPFQSEVLVLGAYEPSGAVRLLRPAGEVSNGARVR